MAADDGNSSAKPPPLSLLHDTDQVQKVFARFDTNGDGTISSDELACVLRALGSDPSDDEVAQMMAEMDTDKDGRINLDDFAHFCKAAHDGAGEEKDLREAFEHYDQDGNGQISATELHQILTRLGERCTVEDCAGMIRSVDADGDGYVSFDEFRKMMTNNK
ncbi:calcium-binding allergen Ole e 8-like [Andrographis paniculata]|uniref:calcium-binding allergen Ole e 8-like n=1 Tax=Andrographis paniculata TaxID=175694 RepID=UPI0021E8BBCE|nr:calcium-binding allergen Ole e 8-like [Andrographis paniculata]